MAVSGSAVDLQVVGPEGKSLGHWKVGSKGGCETPAAQASPFDFFIYDVSHMTMCLLDKLLRLESHKMGPSELEDNIKLFSF